MLENEAHYKLVIINIIIISVIIVQAILQIPTVTVITLKDWLKCGWMITRGYSITTGGI